MFIMVDLFLFPTFIKYNNMQNYFYLVLFQASLLIGLLYGLRGHGKFKGMMMQLESVARNKEINVDERETRLVSLIHHACLELGYTFEERNKTQFNKKHKVQDKKKTKIIKHTKKLKEANKKMSKLVIDEIVWKQIGYSLVGIWGLFGLVIGYWLNSLVLEIVLIIFLVGTWEIIDVFVLFYIHYIFKIVSITEADIEALLEE